MIVLGMDPGLTSFGWCAVRLYVEHEEPIALDVIRTKPSPKKRKVLDREDNWRRVLEVAAELSAVFEDFRPVAVCTEAFSYPMSSSSSAKIAMSWGVLAAQCHEWDTALLQPTPQQVKRAVLGPLPAPKRRRRAKGGRGGPQPGRRAQDARARAQSKAAVQAALRARYAALGPLLDALRPAGQREHAADALGAVVACLGSPEIRLFRKVAYEDKQG